MRVFNKGTCIMMLLEIFDQPKQSTQAIKQSDHARYEFDVGNNDYFVDFQHGGSNLWILNFFEKTNDSRDKKFGGGTPLLTGRAGAKSITVFSTVIAIIQEFAEQYQPKGLFMAADNNESSRAPLYRRLIVARLPGNWKAYHTVITRDQDSLGQERDGYILARGVQIQDLIRPLEQFGITADQWEPIR